MKSARRLVLVLALGTLVAAGYQLTGQAVSAGGEAVISKEMLGKKVPDLTFKTETGKLVSLYEEFKGKKAVVLVFLSFDCPISNSYSKPLADLYKQYSEHVGFLGLTVNQDQTRLEVGKLARKYDLPFPVVLDKHLAAVDALKADITPGAFVLDGDFVLRYRGRLDDTYVAKLKKGPNHQPNCGDVVQVLAEVLSGRPVTVSATEPIGCNIPRADKVPAKDGPVTYYRDVLPIIQNKCQSCHRPGEVGPFSLLTYKHAYNWAEDIKTFTKNRIMPPWKPSGDLAFHNERKLTEQEILTLAKWVDTGCAEGDPKQAPPPAEFPAGWQLGEPDLVLEVPAEFQLGPTGKDLFRCFVLPTKLTDDKYVTAVEVRPGSPGVVHHALLFIDSTGTGRKLELQGQEKEAKPKQGHADTLDKGPGYSVAMGVGFVPTGGLGGWAPGSMPRKLPEGHGYFLPKSADVVLQIHYHRNGRLEKDRTKIGLHFAKKKKDEMKPFQGATLPGGKAGVGPLGLFFAIPPGEERFKLTGQIWAKEDFQLFAITPHMHMLGKEIKATLTPPDGGKPVTLIHIKEWDYNWQESYTFKQPVSVKAGSRFDVEAFYDNSAKNPFNPNSPPKLVTWGEETTNEMCFVFLGGASARPGTRLPTSATEPKIEPKQAAASK